MRVAFVMASHGRLPIVLQNIEHLLTMGEVYISVTERSDYDQIKRAFPYINVILVANHPLGGKWQKTVDVARFHEAEVLITCGSDDVLCHDYVNNALKILDEHEFVGVNGWWMSDGKKHYKASYRYYKNFPAGSGRVFSKKLLDAIDWRIFDKTANKHLDDRAIDELYRRGGKYYISQFPEHDGLKILALKGPWAQLNPLSKFIAAPTIDCRQIESLPTEFPSFKF